MFQVSFMAISIPDLDSDTLLGYGLLITLLWAGPFYIYYAVSANKVQKQLFSTETPVTQDSLLQAYIVLAVAIIHKEGDSRRDKFEYIRKYFYQKFPNCSEDLNLAFREAMEHRVPLKKVADWLKFKLNYNHRVHVIYFLFGVAIVDGRIDPAEIALIAPLSELLGITPKDFDSIYSSYQQKQKKPKAKQTVSPIKVAARILGVSIHASKEEIKKAYRTLVKKYHPDALATESEEHRQIAEDRFVEIQLAYEILMK